MENLFVFNNDNYCSELRKELEIRKKVWPRIPGKDVVFVQHEHQKRFDKMLEILTFFEGLGFKRVELLQHNLSKEIAPPHTLFDD